MTVLLPKDAHAGDHYPQVEGLTYFVRGKEIQLLFKKFFHQTSIFFTFHDTLCAGVYKRYL